MSAGPPTYPPPTSPSLLVPYNGLAAIDLFFTVGGAVTGVAVGLAVDTNQQINMIVRQNNPSGGLEPWAAPSKLPGIYNFPTTPACALSVPSGAIEFSTNIVCAIGGDVTDPDCYAVINNNLVLVDGGPFPYSPVMSSLPNGRVDVFCVKDPFVYQQTMDEEFHWRGSWKELPIGAYGPRLCSAISCADNQIDLLMNDETGLLQLNTLNYTPTSLEATIGEFDLSFQSFAVPVLSSSAPGRLDVLALGMNGGLYHRWRIGTAWSGWELVGWTEATWAKPAVASRAENTLDVVVVGSDNSFYHKYYDGNSWFPAGLTTWDPVGGALNTGVAPALVAPGPTWLELFVKGTDSNWYTNSFNGTSWEGWIGHGVILR